MLNILCASTAHLKQNRLILVQHLLNKICKNSLSSVKEIKIEEKLRIIKIKIAKKQKMEDVVTATQPPPAASTTATTTTAATNQATTISSQNFTPASTAAPAPPPAKKSSTTLSVDRAAFLLLRVKKAFKRKRQHRKEKQAQALNASINNQAGRTNRGKIPPPLLRSRTLPAIIVPGIPVVSLHTDKSPFQWATSSASKSTTSSGSSNRWSILTRNTTATTPTTHQANAWNNNNNNSFNNNNNTLSIKSLNLPKDDGTVVYRRKSSGSTPHGNTTTQTTAGCGSGTPDANMPSYAGTMNISTDDFECYAADGSVLLRIPAPHVVAARAYRLASKKRTQSIFSNSGGGSGGGGSGGSSTSTSDNNTRCSGDNTPTLDGGCQIPGFSVCSSSGGSGYGEANNLTTSGFSTSSTAATSAGGGATSSSTSSNTSTNTALTRRLAKLLHQSSSSVLSKSQHHHHHQHHQHHHQQQQYYQQQHSSQYDTNTISTTTTTSALTAPQPCGEDAPRRLSWERRKDSSALQRSASIDSFAEIVWSDSPRPSLDIPRPAVAPFSKRPSASSLFSNCSTSSQSAQLNINELYVSGGGVVLPGGGTGASVGIGGLTTGVGGSQTTCGGITTTGNSRRESLLSPSSTRRNKLTRIINDNVLPSSLSPNKSATLRSDRSSYNCKHTNNNSSNNYHYSTNSNLQNDDNIVILRNPPLSSLTNTLSSTTSSNASSSVTTATTINHEHQVNLQEQQEHHSTRNFHSLDSNHNQESQQQQHQYRHHHHHQQQQQQQETFNERENATFRWSEQLTQNRQQHQHQHQHQHHYQHRQQQPTHHNSLKLLPPPITTNSIAATSTLSISSSSSISSNNSCSSKMLAENIKSNSATSAISNNNNSLSISRHSNSHKNHHGHSQVGGGVEAVDAGSSSSSGTGVDENNADNKQNLAIYRQPANVRTTKGGNTPHRSKMSKKQLKLAQAQLDKLTQCNLHLHALFSAVEHGHLDKARTILESTDVDVNSINTDGLSALDVAVLSNNRSMTKMLLQHVSVDSIGTKLNGLLKDAELRINDLSGLEGTCQPSFSSRPSISSIIIGNTGSSVTGCTGNEVDKQIGIWERRVKGLRRLLLGWDQARPPDAPASVVVDVTGDNSIQVQMLEPFEGAIGTKFKVQWSTRADFSNIVGERELMDWRSFHGTMGTQCHISGLTQGRRYFLRAACGNVKGWGPYKTSVPASVVPSSWRDLNNREDRYLGRQRMLDNLFTAVRLARPADVSELTLYTNSQQRRNPKKKTTIKQLFSTIKLFHFRGIYLASIVYCEDKVLVTSEDFLPVIEIDESYPSSLYSDYHWLMKVACTWDDVKSLRTDMERNLTSANHFRTKLLSAVCQMQSALGFNDLGQLYYKPLRDAHGTVVLTCIQSVKSQKVVSILNSRWLPVNKLQKKIGAIHEEYNINEVLITSIADQIQYHQTALQRLTPGLYLGYLKMQCSMDQIQVVVPAKTPNVLPHYKVRDNSHITAEEWQVLKKNSEDRSNDGRRSASPLRLTLNFNTNSEATTEVQRLFLYDLTTATHKLFKYMNIKPEEASTHRLYDVEVIEHSKEISFLIICPSVELSCAVPGQSELLLQREDLASLSIQAFEMIHLSTYQPGIIQKYARLSCILELDTALANHSQREAFSTLELQTAKERLAKLQELTSSLNAVWKAVRWLMDVIAFARDKNAPPSAAMREILDFGQQVDENSQLLQPPIRDMKFTKSGSGRGSWPGPGASTGSNMNMGPEHSKSEQNLGLKASTPTSGSSHQKQQNQMQTTQTNAATPATPNYLQVNNDFMTSDVSLRKNSGDSGTSHYTTQSFNSATDSVLTSVSDFGQIFNMPPSRSDDTLSEAARQQNQKSQVLQRKRTCSNITPTSTPVTPLITVHSSSVPYLGRDSASGGSCQSLKVNYNGEYESKQIKTAEKVKSASSANLRDNALYLKTTLTTIKSEIKKTNCTSLDENLAPTSSSSSNSKNLQRQSSQEEYTATSCPSLATDTTEAINTPSGIIQVYTAYNTGLASGTSLKLHVTAKTTAREVVNLVVKQLNMAAVLKGSNGPIYSTDMLDNFCLVAVIGARERCLRDDFKPLLLQNPWKKGRLYVRQKHELLAAIEHSNRKSHLI
ncbi:Ankyrin repeat and fibronectin type-III domain-containing protein 1 [Lucilia cuprina]|nr:Ankyrin repeat and fibronectin type-III domain-containing protein 1 [Lucilia cuprina]